MSDDWRYMGDPNEQALKDGRRYMQLNNHITTLSTAIKLLENYEEPKDPHLGYGPVTHLLEKLKERREKLKPQLKVMITCDGCWGARREGHGERCGRCGGSGEISVRLRVGAY